MAYRLSTLLHLKLQDDDEFASIVPTAENFEAVDAAIAADRERINAIETPSVTAAATLTTIQSGDTLSKILGKVKTLITRFLDHDGAGSTAHCNATTNVAGFMSAADKAKLDGIAEQANKYTHPTTTAKSSGLYKIAVNALGHVSSAAAVQKSDITALGITGADVEKDIMYNIDIIQNGVAKGIQEVTYGVRVDNMLIGYAVFPSSLSIAANATETLAWKVNPDWDIVAATPQGYGSLEVKSVILSSNDKIVTIGVKNNSASAVDASDLRMMLVLKRA